MSLMYPDDYNYDDDNDDDYYHDYEDYYFEPVDEDEENFEIQEGPNYLDWEEEIY